MCVERMVTPRQRRWRIGKAFCQRASPSPFSLEDPADTADSYACWTGENADEAAVGWTERVRQQRSSAATRCITVAQIRLLARETKSGIGSPLAQDSLRRRALSVRAAVRRERRQRRR